MSTEIDQPFVPIDLRRTITALDDLHERAWCAQWTEVDELATALGYRGDLRDGEAAGRFIKDRIYDALRNSIWTMS